MIFSIRTTDPWELAAANLSKAKDTRNFTGTSSLLDRPFVPDIFGYKILEITMKTMKLVNMKTNISLKSSKSMGNTKFLVCKVF